LPGLLYAILAYWLADEPTGNLDTKTSDSILELFEELHRQGQTIVMVTHEHDVAQHARRIIRMQDVAFAANRTTNEDNIHEQKPAEKGEEST